MSETKEKDLNEETAEKEEADKAEEVKAGEAPETEEKAEENTEEAPEEEKTDGEEKKADESEKKADEGKTSGGKRFWQKKEKKDKKDEKIEELNDKLIRNMAEFDNFRKRTEKEKAANYTIGAKSVIEKLLPVLDNFERGLAGANMEDAFAQGMEKIYKQMQTTMNDLGVTEIDAVGKEFDPNLHNAVMHVDDESLGENVVAEVLQKGYMYKDQVVRYAMVKVAN